MHSFHLVDGWVYRHNAELQRVVFNIHQFLTFPSPFTLLRCAASGPVMKEDARKLSWKFHILTVLVNRSNVTRGLGIFVPELWSNVVSSSMADFLQATYPCHSHIWWCTTSKFSPFFLHVAGLYGEG